MLGNASCFLLALLVGVQVDIAGGVSAIEFALPVFSSIYMIFRRIPKFDHNFQIVFFSGLVFLVSLMLSDIWNSTPFEQYSRGWARVVVFLSNFVSLYILVDSRRARLLWLTFGMVVGRVWLSLEGMQDGLIVWKLGLAKPLALATLLMCVTLPKLKAPGSSISSLLILTLGLINIVADFRSLGAVLVIVAALMVLADRGRTGKRHRKKTPIGPVAAMVIAGCLAVVTSSWFYGYAATQGWLSTEATQKFEAQTDQTNLPLVLAGRSESLVSIEAIMDAPLLGHGSWPKDPYYADKLALRRYELGLSESVALVEEDLIPTHSHLLGSWVEAGVAGGMFWSLVLFLVGKSLLRSCRSQSHMQVFYIFSAVLLIWDVLFSPFAGFRRFETAFLLIVVLRALLQRSSLSIKSATSNFRSDRKGRLQSRRRRLQKRRSPKTLSGPRGSLRTSSGASRQRVSKTSPISLPLDAQ